MPRGTATYIFAVTVFCLFALVVGFVSPRLVSARDDASVLLGVGAVLLLPIGIALIVRRWRRTGEGKRVVRAAKKWAPVLLVGLMLGACSKVPAGNVGVIVNLYGSDKGVSEKEVGVGRYWVGWSEELFVFPTFTQNDTWQKAGAKDESITFQTGRDGMALNADFGITFRVDPGKVTRLYQTYRKGVEEISDIYLRNLVRDALNERAAEMSADEAYGRRKNDLLDMVEADVRKAVADKGIIVEKVYLVADIRLPPQVRAALDLKNAAFQQTLQREQEVAKAKAEADIKIAEARGRGESVLIEAKAQAEANRLVAASVTSDLVQYRALDRWDGVLPRLLGSGAAMPFLDLSREVDPARRKTATVTDPAHSAVTGVTCATTAGSGAVVVPYTTNVPNNTTSNRKE